MEKITEELNREFTRLIERAHEISADVGTEIDLIFQEEDSELLNSVEIRKLIDKVINAIQRKLDSGDHKSQVVEQLSSLADELIKVRELNSRDLQVGNNPIEMVEHKGISPHPVKPTPTFHMREVALTEGFVRTKDIDLWDSNERIEIHLQQFAKKYGRKPSPQELLDIMFCHLKLDGVTEEDQFGIPALARSIAANGLRKYPILSFNGRLLDGNRRLAACYYILTSDEFTIEQKKRVEYILVWRLTEHSDEDDEQAIIVSLNFENDHKQEWPEYVKARKVHLEWESALALDPTAGSSRQLQIRRDISKKFALGSDVSVVTRYIRMVTSATEFEDYHIIEKRRDKYEVKHKAAQYFQYFDELTKGVSSGKLGYELGRNPTFKHLVFELLYAGKFKNWRQIRDLIYIMDNQVAIDALHEQAEIEITSVEKREEIQDNVDRAIALGKAKQAEQRQIGKNARIEVFVKWLLELPVGIFQDPNQISPANVKDLHDALKFVTDIMDRNSSTDSTYQ
ncbi:hypothetical protein HFRIS_011238 [Herbaspirillum frisingense GSF30]|uniref:Uncharacterized protein n=1 Tax=Herbaspirillum frisingense GSF30 TaxID=864073 RepID=A0AAI9IER6_9BURK|nr:hypothetical protein [Herbaspirillum frisingense]EOA04725.1 hypothetical protein HFRIS_011238 [Herbaspirillum frisingense GSF30]